MARHCALRSTSPSKRRRREPRRRTLRLVVLLAGGRWVLARATRCLRWRARSTATRTCGVPSRSPTASTTRCVCRWAPRCLSLPLPKPARWPALEPVVADRIRHGARPHIALDGSQLREEFEVLIERLLVDTSLHTPDLVEVRLRDGGH